MASTCGNYAHIKGQKILIHDGAGGIGSIAIPLAKNLDAHIALTAISDDEKFVKNLGDDKLIDLAQWVDKNNIKISIKHFHWMNLPRHLIM